jgi:hypothetical protein
MRGPPRRSGIVRAMDPAPYRSSQRFAVMWCLLPLPALVASVAMAGRPDPAQLTALVSAWALCVVGLAWLGRLVIEVRDGRLVWTFGYLGWPRWHLALNDIGLLQCVRVSALRGAGIRGIGKDRLFSVAVGSPALRVTTRDGHAVTLGSQEPQRLQAAIEAALQARR